MSGFTSFGDARKQAFHNWEGTTFRNCDGINDELTGSWECKWQDAATERNYNHISIFCSLGDWGSNVTDILKDNRYDSYSFFGRRASDSFI